MASAVEDALPGAVRAYRRLGLLEALDHFLEAVVPIRRQRALAPLVKRAQTKLAKAFATQGRAYLKRLASHKADFREAADSPDAGTLDAALTEWDATAVETAGLLADPIDELAALALSLGAGEQIADLGLDLSFDLANPRAVDYLTKYGASQVTKIDDTTRDRLRTLLADDLANGDSYATIAADIASAFDGFSSERAQTIAVYESALAYESGKAIVSQDLQSGGLELEKSVLTAGDDRVEDLCLANEAQGWIPLDDAFASGDQNAPFHVRCRCSTLYRRANGDEGDQIA